MALAMGETCRPCSRRDSDGVDQIHSYSWLSLQPLEEAAAAAGQAQVSEVAEVLVRINEQGLWVWAVRLVSSASVCRRSGPRSAVGKGLVSSYAKSLGIRLCSKIERSHNRHVILNTLRRLP